MHTLSLVSLEGMCVKQQSKFLPQLGSPFSVDSITTDLQGLLKNLGSPGYIPDMSLFSVAKAQLTNQ